MGIVAASTCADYHHQKKLRFYRIIKTGIYFLHLPVRLQTNNLVFFGSTNIKRKGNWWWNYQVHAGELKFLFHIPPLEGIQIIALDEGHLFGPII